MVWIIRPGRDGDRKDRGDYISEPVVPLARSRERPTGLGFNQD